MSHYLEDLARRGGATSGVAIRPLRSMATDPTIVAWAGADEPVGDAGGAMIDPDVRPPVVAAVPVATGPIASWAPTSPERVSSLAAAVPAPVSAAPSAAVQRSVAPATVGGLAAPLPSPPASVASARDLRTSAADVAGPGALDAPSPPTSISPWIGRTRIEAAVDVALAETPAPVLANGRLAAPAVDDAGAPSERALEADRGRAGRPSPWMTPLRPTDSDRATNAAGLDGAATPDGRTPVTPSAGVEVGAIRVVAPAPHHASIVESATRSDVIGRDTDATRTVVHIGSIEIRPPAVAPPPAVVATPPPAAGPIGFDDYRSLRAYRPWER